MTLRPQVVRERLRKLGEVVENLRRVRDVEREEFVASFRHYWLAERGLHLAAEAVFDIGNHVLSGHFNVHATDYENVLQRLAEQGVLSEELREAMRGLGGFRNVLVHAYLEVDEARVYDALQEELPVFDRFAEEIVAFLEVTEGG